MHRGSRSRAVNSLLGGGGGGGGGGGAINGRARAV